MCLVSELNSDIIDFQSDDCDRCMTAVQLPKATDSRGPVTVVGLRDAYDRFRDKRSFGSCDGADRTRCAADLGRPTDEVRSVPIAALAKFAGSAVSRAEADQRVGTSQKTPNLKRTGKVLGETAAMRVPASFGAICALRGMVMVRVRHRFLDGRSQASETKSATSACLDRSARFAWDPCTTRSCRTVMDPAGVVSAIGRPRSGR